MGLPLPGDMLPQSTDPPTWGLWGVPRKPRPHADHTQGATVSQQATLGDEPRGQPAWAVPDLLFLWPLSGPQCLLCCGWSHTWARGREALVTLKKTANHMRLRWKQYT